MKKINILALILLLCLIVNVIVFGVLFNELSFINKLIPILVDLVLLAIICGSIYFSYKLIVDITDKGIILIIISIILNIILLIFNISSNTFNKAMDKITSKEEVYTSTIIVKNGSSISTIDDLVGKNIGISGNTDDLENYKLVYEYLDKNDKVNNNTFYRYSDYILAINDLLDGTIDALVISGNYIDLYSEYFADLNTTVKPIINNIEYAYTVDNNSTKNTSEPFTMLIIGADGTGATYHSDVLILMTVNPNTKKVVMVDVVRDTYTYNLGNNMMDKITHSGNYGTQNVVNTVSNLFGMNIDYYVKMNYQAVIKLVDMMGGITIDVPYRFPVKTSSGTYYVEAGTRKLNGLETLTLARTRKVDGSSLLTRGEEQMNIIEVVTKEIDSSFLLNNYFNIMDLIGNNISTNMSKQDMYYYIQLYMGIKNDLVFSHNQLKGTDSSYYYPIMGMTLYTYKVDDSSLSAMKTLLIDNL